MLFFRKCYLNRDFPLNRFQAADWSAWLASARWQPIDDIGHRGMSITTPQDNGEFAFDMPAAWVKNNTLPPLLLDILTQLNDIDNIMQQSCRRLAERHKRHSREYELYLFDPPDALYVTQGGVPYLDYTANTGKQKFSRISEAKRRQVAAVLRRGLYQTVSGRLRLPENFQVACFYSDQAA